MAAWIAVDRYAMNSRLGDLVQQDAGWRTDYEAFQAAFPQLVETAMVVVSGASFKQVEDAAVQLETLITARTDQFVDVYAPANEIFFRDNALLFMGTKRLDDLGDALAQAQPMLTTVANDPSLRGVLGLVESGLVSTAPAGFDQLLDKLVRSAQAVADESDPLILWSDDFLAGEGETHYRIIFLRGRQNYGVSLPNAALVASLKKLIASTPMGASVSIQLTGEIALRHDEVQAAVGGVQIAGLFAFLLLAAVLAFGVRSIHIVVATFVLLVTGVVWTAAWAMIAIGSFNTLSLVFLVMFFGLGVDFCVHYCLRVQEALPLAGATIDDLEEALALATYSVGGAIVLCTVTTAIGFLGFVPTQYKGLADLGVISAGGMAIACVLTFTLLPAFFALFGAPAGRLHQLPGGVRLITGLQQLRVPVLSILGVCVIGCLYLIPRAQFDYSVLALRDPETESMQALRELQREKQITDYALYALTTPADLDRIRSLTQLDSVERVTTPRDYLPADQANKLYALEDMQELLGSALTPQSKEPLASIVDLRLAVDSAQHRIETLLQSELKLNSLGGVSDPGLNPKRVALLHSLQQRLAAMALASDAQVLAWQGGVIDNLVEELGWLRRALGAVEVGLEDLPEALKARLITADGRHLSAILPAKDIAPIAALSEFISSVRGEISGVTGRPLVEWGVGAIVVQSFKTALLVALTGISVVLLLVLRSFRDTLLVLTPLLLTGLFTVATIVLIEVPVNMASVLVLPLIFGLGVDNGIHMVRRFQGSENREANDKDNSAVALMRSSTPRAVLLSTLTTIGTFAALMLSPHAGTASIGFLLTVAVTWLLVFTCFGLPLLLSLVTRRFDALSS